MTAFILGCFVGGFITSIVVCLLAMARQESNRHNRK